MGGEINGGIGLTWKGSYDIVNSTFTGDTVLFGEHYTIKEAKKIMKDAGLELYESTDPEHIWIRFGFIECEDDGKIINGWHVLEKKPESMRGCIEGTIVGEW